MPVNQKNSGQLAGYFPVAATSNFSSLLLTAAGTWLAFSFVPDATKTVAKVKVFSDSVGGTLGASDLTCDIYSDNGGVPNASLSSTATVTATPLGGDWVEFTGLSQAVTASTLYWLVFKNVNGTPASNFPSYQFGLANSGSQSSFGTQNTAWGWLKAQTANSGASWTSIVANTCGVRIEYSDSSFAGEPIQLSMPSAAAQGVYLTRENGVTFVVPSGVIWNVRGLALPAGRVGAPAGNLRFRLYNNTTLLGTTNTQPLANTLTSARYTTLYFTSDIALSGGTTARVTASTTTGGDASNYYMLTERTIDNDANSKALFPFATAANPTNGVKRTYFNGSTWTDTDTVVIPFALILDSDGEYQAAASGGGPGHTLVVRGQNLPAY